jgi:hypothetical protein
MLNDINKNENLLSLHFKIWTKKLLALTQKIVFPLRSKITICFEKFKNFV